MAPETTPTPPPVQNAGPPPAGPNSKNALKSIFVFDNLTLDLGSYFKMNPNGIK
jgi:hypothetical protein